MRNAVIGIGLAAQLGACGGGGAYLPEMEGRTVYTLVNLHPDEKQGRLYSANYQRGGLLPLCTPVTLLAINSKLLTFRVEPDGQRYQYIFHYKSLTEPVEAHLRRVFGPACDLTRVRALPEVDQKGIEEGRAIVGMSKQAVLLAMGYPPATQTPSLDADRWVYWLHHFNRMEVGFENGFVTYVHE